jgi:hypothetical protein
MLRMSISANTFIDTLRNMGINNQFVTRSQLQKAAETLNLSAPPTWAIADSRKVSRGIYSIPEILGKEFIKATSTVATVAPISHAPVNAEVPAATMNLAAAVLGMTNGERESLIPEVNKEYVAWGHYSDINLLVQSNKFFTAYITGLSGNGKTTMIEQICANSGRECFRVNIVGTTDEDDLIGGFRLQNGNTLWQDGPVVEAMKRGAVLLLDEIDLGSERIMCLQSVLEGKGVYIKKINQWVTPTKGFCVVATANTKGKGSDDGRFVGTNIMNEAFLDRFDYTFEQEYASKTIEKKILVKMMAKNGVKDDTFADNLVTWAEMIRKSFLDDAVDEIISTRRLINIIKAYSVYGDKHKAIRMSLARFDKATGDGFFAIFTKIEAPKVEAEPAKEEAKAPTDNSVPF